MKRGGNIVKRGPVKASRRSSQTESQKVLSRQEGGGGRGEWEEETIRVQCLGLRWCLRIISKNVGKRLSRRCRESSDNKYAVICNDVCD